MYPHGMQLIVKMHFKIPLTKLKGGIIHLVKVKFIMNVFPKLTFHIDYYAKYLHFPNHIFRFTS